jgi:hypothetical protein
VGSFNLCNRFLAYYNSSVQARKWKVRFIHFVDLVIINYWLMYCCSCRVAGICKRGHLSLTSYETHLGTSLIISEVSINNITQILRSCSFYIHSDSAQETEASKNDENSLPKETQECFQSPNFREDITRLVTFVNTLLIGLLRNEDIRAANLG